LVLLYYIFITMHGHLNVEFDIILRHTVYSLCCVLFASVPLYCDTRHNMKDTVVLFTTDAVFGLKISR